MRLEILESLSPRLRREILRWRNCSGYIGYKPGYPTSVPNSNLWCSTALKLVAAHAALSLLWLWREARVREQIEVLLVFAVREKVNRRDIHPLRYYVTVCCAR